MAIQDVTAIVRDTLYDLIETYNRSVNIYPFSNTGTLNQYNQRPTAFSAAVAVKAHLVMYPTDDDYRFLSMPREPDTGFAMITRKHLIASFPLAVDPMKAISDKDQIAFDLLRYRITSIRKSGYLDNVSELLVVIFNLRTGVEYTATMDP